MSQHFFTAKHDDRDVDVLIGWDRALQSFFLVVTLIDPVDYEDETIYSSVTDEEIGVFETKPLDYFKDKLTSLGLELPTLISEQVITDACRNVGNRVCCYESVNGEWSMTDHSSVVEESQLR
jgi:hypothetical protein